MLPGRENASFHAGDHVRAHLTVLDSCTHSKAPAKAPKCTLTEALVTIVGHQSTAPGMLTLTVIVFLGRF